MELYVFSEALLLLGTLDDLERCACTLRYNAAGTLEAVCGNTSHNRELLRHGHILALRQTRGLTGTDAVPFHARYDGFWIDTIEYEIGDEGNRIAVTGSGLSALLKLRVVPSDWVAERNSAEEIDELVDRHCIHPSDAARILPFLRLAGDFSDGAEILREGGWDSVYDGVRALAESADTGFAVDLLASRRLVFRQYKGTDRSSGKKGRIPLLSEAFGNLIESGYRDDRTDWRTTAYVRTGIKTLAGTEKLATVNGEQTGFARREAIVSASVDEDESQTSAERLERIQAAGKEALLRCAPDQRLDASIREEAGLVFRRDYGLGDRFLVRSNRFGLETVLPIQAVNEYWENGAYQVQPVLGDEQPQRIRRLARLLNNP